MKSERRHELERNVLADRLGSGIEAVQPVLPFILGGLAVLAVGGIAWGIYSNSANSRAADAWTDFYFNLTGGDAEDFVDVADTHPSTSASAWARLTAGNNYLMQGINALYENREEGEFQLQQAIDAFEEVLASSPGEALRYKALIGLAQAQESLGNLDEALGTYQQVLASSTLPPRVLSAISERVSFLTSQPGQEFYAWFSKLEPKPDAPIDLGDLSVPPTLQGEGIEFGGAGDATNSGGSTLPELDLDGLNLPTQETAPSPGADSINELELPPTGEPTAESPTTPKTSEPGATAEPGGTTVGSGTAEAGTSESDGATDIPEENAGENPPQDGTGNAAVDDSEAQQGSVTDSESPPEEETETSDDGS